MGGVVETRNKDAATCPSVKVGNTNQLLYILNPSFFRVEDPMVGFTESEIKQ